MCTWLILCARGTYAANCDALSLIVENEQSEQCIGVFIEKVNLENVKITETINSSSDISVSLLKACVERGINSFFIGELDSAIEDFTYVLRLVNPDEERQLFGTAIWGRMLCHAFAESIEKTCEDIQLIRQLFIDNIPCGQNKFPKGGWAFQHVGYALAQNRYEDAHRKLTPQECNNRVNGTANVIRTIALKIKNPDINGIVNFVISQVENIGYRCCQDAPDWTKCLDPIVNVWNHLKVDFNRLQALYEEGVPLSSFLQAP